MRCIVSCGSTSFPWLLRSSSVRVHESQAYRKMDVTREHISCVLELREVLLSFQTGFNLVTAAVACAVLESISGLEPSLVITEPRYLKLVTVSSFCHPQWGAADAEIKVPSGENTELKRSPFQAWSRSVYSNTCYAYCQGFLPCLFLSSGPFTGFFSPKPLPIFPVFAVANTWFLCRPAE